MYLSKNILLKSGHLVEIWIFYPLHFLGMGKKVCLRVKTL